MSRYQNLLENETLADGASSDRWHVAGMETTEVLVGACTYNAMVFEIWYVIDTEDGEVELLGYHPDPTSNTWHSWSIPSANAACCNIPTMGATWMYLKNSGGADITGAYVWAAAREGPS